MTGSKGEQRRSPRQIEAVRVRRGEPLGLVTVLEEVNEAAKEEAQAQGVKILKG